MIWIITIIILTKTYFDRKKIPLLLFNLGFILYLLLPIIYLNIVNDSENYLIINYYINFKETIKNQQNYLLIYLMIFNFMFSLPFYKKNGQTKQTPKKEFKIQKVIIILILIVTYISLFMIYISIRKEIFLGYKNYTPVRGTIASLLNISFINNLVLLIKKKRKINNYLIIHLFLSIPLLIMGTSMYFLFHLIAYLV